jgi:PEGA domain
MRYGSGKVQFSSVRVPVLMLVLLLGSPAGAQQPPSDPPAGDPPAGEPPAGDPPGDPPPSTAPKTPPPADPAADSGPKPADLEQAKTLFKEGNALRKAGDCQGAVVKYAASRALVAAVANTKNAAVCLRDLGRADEALEMYEDLLTKFSDDLSADERQIVSSETNALRAEVGAVDVVANVDGVLVIDGRSRGKLPLSLPVRVMPGSHKIVVLEQGYKSFEKTIEVKVRQTIAVDATLEPLADAGEVRITAEALKGAQVFVDGAPLGVVPWEGSLEPGEHRFFLRRGDEGSAPTKLDVVKGQTIQAKADLGALGPDLRIEVQPSTARLLLDGVPVGTGRWQGRLPLGNYEITAEEEGYITQKKSLDVGARTDRAALELAVDDDHPRWEVAIPGGPWVEVLGGGMIAPSFNGLFEGAECNLFDDCTGDAFGAGFIVMGRGGYEFPMGLSVMAGAGFMQMQRSAQAPIGIDGDEQSQEINVQGPFGIVGVRQRFVFAEIFETRISYSFGFMGMGSKADITVFDALGEFDVDNEGGGFNLFLMPEIQFGMRFGGLGVALGFATPLFLLDDPNDDVEDVEWTTGGLYENFFAFLPSASVSYLF